MGFNNWLYPVFFTVVFAVYLALERPRPQNRWLLAASLFFYGLWDWRFLAPLLLSGMVDFYVARAMARQPDRLRRRPLLMISLVTNISFLAYFKYAGLLAEGLHSFASLMGLDVFSAPIRAVLPVGMSFYTFHALSYVIDVYRGEVEPAERLEDFLLFLSYFPQLISGPIARAKSLLPQLLRSRTTTAQDVDAAVPLILWGYFKKLVVADNLARVAASGFSHRAGSVGLDTYIGAVAFTVQLYCDFSGFIDIARGCSRLMGIELQLNFKRPFFARSPAEFWRRHHISLSEWLRDYLYIPLGGSRRGIMRTALNIMIVMGLAGLWHGAQWQMILWGLYEGLRLIVWRIVLGLFPALERTGAFGSWLMRICTFGSFAFGMILFRSSSLSEAVASMRGLGVTEGPNSWALAAAVAYLAWPVFCWDFLEEFFQPWVEALSARSTVRALVYGVLLLTLALFGARRSGAFLYYQF